MGWVARRWRHAVFVVAASLTAVVTVPATVPAIAAPGVPGIDVSKYQRRIEWSAVASSPVRFAIMRATLGNRYRDERYAQNLAGATANGLVVGAYHFAKPTLGLRDARGEADHFLRVARVEAGDVLPVLDIEETGGLSSEQLRVWAQAWLHRVHVRTGVRAMIYSGNHFWRGFMRNTSWFGHRGHPLWVAHWNVGAPDVPGDRWANNGYTVWQWSATGNVPGIRGAVDEDWVNGDLTRATIASLTVAPAQGGSIRGERIACGDPQDRCFRLDNPGDEIVLSATPGSGARLARWTGACAPAGDAPTCTVSALGDKTVSAVFDAPLEVAVVGSDASSETALPVRVGCPAVCSSPTLADPRDAEPPVSDEPDPEAPPSQPSVSALPVPATPRSRHPRSRHPRSRHPRSRHPRSRHPRSRHPRSRQLRSRLLRWWRTRHRRRSARHRRAPGRIRTARSPVFSGARGTVRRDHRCGGKTSRTARAIRGASSASEARSGVPTVGSAVPRHRSPSRSEAER